MFLLPSSPLMVDPGTLPFGNAGTERGTVSVIHARGRLGWDCSSRQVPGIPGAITRFVPCSCMELACSAGSALPCEGGSRPLGVK